MITFPIASKDGMKGKMILSRPVPGQGVAAGSTLPDAKNGKLLYGGDANFVEDDVLVAVVADTKGKSKADAATVRRYANTLVFKLISTK